jgi:hypothetical protein
VTAFCPECQRDYQRSALVIDGICPDCAADWDAAEAASEPIAIAECQCQADECCPECCGGLDGCTRHSRIRQSRHEQADRIVGLMRQRRSGDLLAAMSLDAQWERRLRAAR